MDLWSVEAGAVDPCSPFLCVLSFFLSRFLQVCFLLFSCCLSLRACVRVRERRGCARDSEPKLAPFRCVPDESFSAVHDSVRPLRCRWGSNPTSPPAGRRLWVFVQWQPCVAFDLVVPLGMQAPGAVGRLCKQGSCTIAHALGRLVELNQVTKCLTSESTPRPPGTG